MGEVTTHQQTAVALTPERVDNGLAVLRRHHDSLLTSVEARDKAQRCIDALSRPAEVEEIAFEVTALKGEYFEKKAPSDPAARSFHDAIQDRNMRGWYNALKDFPIWAIQRACDWYQSADNEYRGRPPKHGDISKQCLREMRDVNIAINRISLAELQARLNGDKEPQGKPISEEQRADVAETLKTFGIDKEKEK